VAAVDLSKTYSMESRFRASRQNPIKILRPWFSFPCLSTHIRCFFRDTIEETYNKDASLCMISIKKNFIYFRAWLPYTDPLRPLGSTLTTWCSLVGRCTSDTASPCTLADQWYHKYHRPRLAPGLRLALPQCPQTIVYMY
jgi:hypothetical protein